MRSISNYTKLPLQEHYIQLLAKEGIQDQQAKELIAILDNQVRQQLAVKSAKYLSGKDYVQLMKRYEETISSFRHNMSASQADFIQTLRNDYAALHQEIAQTQVDGKHENRQLESGMQLDLNLEEKRRSESKGEIDQKAAGIEGYAEERITEIQEDLSTVSKQARSAIFAFGSVALASLVMYHVSSSGPH